MNGKQAAEENVLSEPCIRKHSKKKRKHSSGGGIGQGQKIVNSNRAWVK